MKKSFANYTDDNIQHNSIIKDKNIYSNNNANSANENTIKGKIFKIEENLSNLKQDLIEGRSEAELLTSVANSTNTTLLTKIGNMEDSLTNNLDTMDRAIRKYIEDQKRENNKYLQTLSKLKEDKQKLSNQISVLTQRLNELEEVIGKDE